MRVCTCTYIHINLRLSCRHIQENTEEIFKLCLRTIKMENVEFTLIIKQFDRINIDFNKKTDYSFSGNVIV